jgi:hypothetical protein
VIYHILCGCNNSKRDKISNNISAQIVKAEYTDLKNNRTIRHYLPTVNFVVRLKNLSNTVCRINLDSLDSNSDCFLFVNRAEPYVANLIYNGFEDNKFEKVNDSVGIVLPRKTIVLACNDSTDLYFKYNKDDIMDVLKLYNDKHVNKTAETVYLEYLKNMIDNNSVYVSFKVNNTSLVAGRNKSIWEMVGLTTNKKP